MEIDRDYQFLVEPLPYNGKSRLERGIKRNRPGMRKKIPEPSLTTAEAAEHTMKNRGESHPYVVPNPIRRGYRIPLT